MVFTTTTSGASPEIFEPDIVIELDAITAMNCGTWAGGVEPPPTEVLQ